jgi:hypothetical protein
MATGADMKQINSEDKMGRFPFLDKMGRFPFLAPLLHRRGEAGKSG